MKTKIESIPCTFGQIYVGNVFEDKDNHIYMKIGEINFRPHGVNNPVLPANAISLGNASLCWYKQDELIKCITIDNVEE